jgi:hypothetical protein
MVGANALAYQPPMSGSAATPMIRPIGTMQSTTQTPDRNMVLLGQEIMDTPGFAQSVAMEIWSYLPEDEQRLRRDARAYAEEMTGKILTEVWYFEQRHVPIFTAINEYHNQNVDFALLSRQWTDDERQVFADQGLLPYINNTMRSFALHALGEKMGQRTEWKARAKRPEHDAYATAANIGMNWAARVSKWKMSEQYVYRDAMVGCRGVAGVRRDPKNPMGGILLERYRPQEFMWDVATARDPRLTGTKYMERVYLDTRTNMMCEFPEWANEIMTHTAPGMWGLHFSTLQAMIQPKIDAPTGSGGFATVFQPLSTNVWRDQILRREFFRRHPLKKYRVVDGYRKKIIDFYTADQATAWMRATREYWKNILAANGMDGVEPMVSDVQPVFVDVIERVMLAGNIVLRVEEFGQDMFPYHFFVPEWIDGSITSFFGHGKDHQRIINRMYTRIDQAAGGVKGKAIVNRWALQQEYTQQELDANLASDTAPLYVNIPPGMSMDEVIKITGTPSIGELPTMLLRMSMEGQQQMFGGLNAIGQEQSSQESGRAVMARQSAASVAMIPYEEEFACFKEDVGKALIQQVQSLDHVTLSAIIDQAPNDPDAITARDILLFGDQSLREIDLDIEITQVAASPSTRDRRLQQTSFVMAQSPELAKYLLPSFMEDADMDEDVRRKVMEAMQADQQQEQQAAQQEFQHKQWLETQELDLKHMDRILRMKELSIKETPPPTLAASMKIAPSPAIEATVFNRLGMPADPLGMMQDKAMMALFEQQVRNMVQDEFNKRVPVWEKQSGRSTSNGVSSPQDANARANKGPETTS